MQSAVVGGVIVIVLLSTGCARVAREGVELAVKLADNLFKQGDDVIRQSDNAVNPVRIEPDSAKPKYIPGSSALTRLGRASDDEQKSASKPQLVEDLWFRVQSLTERLALDPTSPALQRDVQALARAVQSLTELLPLNPVWDEQRHQVESLMEALALVQLLSEVQTPDRSSEDLRHQVQSLAKTLARNPRSTELRRHVMSRIEALAR